MPATPTPGSITNPYGYFDEDAREFVITRPDTPTPWINYLGEGRYGGIVSNTGGGFSFDRDPRNRRVTRYRYNSIPADQPGRYIYLRDQKTGDYWSPTIQPVPDRKYAGYECRHGAGYTRITSSFAGIRSDVLYFIPPAPPEDKCPCELWVLRVKNTSRRPRTLRTFTYSEFCYPDAPLDTTNIDWGQQILFSRAQDGILTTHTQFRPTSAFFASSVKTAGFDTERETFVGRLRGLSNPQVVEEGKSRGSIAPRGNNIGSLSHNLTLKPGEEKTIVFMLGITDHPELIPGKVARFRKPAAVEEAFRALLADWDAFLGAFTVETPDREMNAMLNTWNPIQCRANLYWSRFVSAYDTGLGRGLGTRDSAQDTLGTVHNHPAHARDVLTMLWKLQFRDGHAWHQVFPLTGEGGPGLAGDHPDMPQWFSDDHLWLVIATCNYLKETADFAYLDEAIQYYDNGSASIWDHMLQAVEFTLEHRGPQGLPRLGFSDWDDTMNLDHGSGKAESVWTAEQFCRALLDLTDLSRAVGKQAEASRFEALHQAMAAVIREKTWDGAWYTRAYDDDGLPVGVSAEQFHRIGLNPQTWAVIGEIGDPARQRQAMESAHEMLNTRFGLRVMWPPYDHPLKRVGGTDTYPPGAKENGGIFCHANTWAIVAAAQLGWADRAYLYYRQILPLARRDADTLLTEPYVYSQNICAPEHPHFGRARTSWLTGTAAWTYVAGTQWILGIRPTYSGLQVAPVIPDGWKGFTAERKFRGVIYRIKVTRVGPGAHVKLSVQGNPVIGDVVPFPPAGTTDVIVEVRLGS
jgi:cellobiose phosphorylase